MMNLVGGITQYHVRWMELFALMISLILHSANSLSKNKDPYSPLEIQNDSPYPISIACAEKKAVDGHIRMQFILSEFLTPNSGAQLGSPYLKSMHLELFENNLFCEFSFRSRSWNCVESYIVQPLCVYENPEVLSTRNKEGGYSDDDCPICDEWPHTEKPRCRWKIESDGVYVSQFSPPRGCQHYLRKSQFMLNPFSWGLADKLEEYYVSILNDLDHELLVAYGPEGGGTIFRRLPSRQNVPEGQRTVGFTLSRATDPDRLVRWLCKFALVATLEYRKDIVLWIPPGDPKDEMLCIDYAWKASASGLYLDSRGCNQDNPDWVKKFDWVGPNRQHSA